MEKNPIFKDVESKIIELRGERVIIDADVAALYGVATKEINQAVRNNVQKFPEGYIIEMTKDEKAGVVKNFDLLGGIKFSNTLPKAFTEKGLYMLATILKSKRATETTLAIVETFAKFRELSRNIKSLAANPTKERQNALAARSGEIMSSLLE